MNRIVEKVNFAIPKQPKAKRVAAYARVSSGKDEMLHSLSAQISYYSELIQSHPGWLYCGVFSDEAYTGTKDNRTGFQNLISECRSGNIDLIITKSISRFARNTVTLLETVRELKLNGIDVFFEEQNIHTISADGELMMTILASYAQAESLSASENQKWRIRKAFENGEIVNLRFLFGYRINGAKIEIDHAQADIVREVFERAVNGESFTAIAKDLNNRNITRCLGGKWNSQRIRDLLSNEKYLGNALLQKKYRNNHLEKKLIHNEGQLPPPTINPLTRISNTTVKKRRTAGYARVSTDKDEQFTSYEAQIDYYTSFIKNHSDWEFVKVYTDEGISGLNTKSVMDLTR